MMRNLKRRSAAAFVVVLAVVMAFAAVVFTACGDPTTTDITLDTAAVKTVFTVGEEFTYDGLKVTAKMSDDTAKTVALKDCKVTAPDMTTAGTKTVTVTFDSKSKTYEITVNEPAPPPVTLQSIALDTSKVKKDYFVGDTFGADNLVVTATMSDGTTAAVAAADYTVTTPDMTTAGTKTVTVTYQGKTAAYDIIVSEKTAESPTVASIALDTAQVKKAYAQGDAFTAEGLVVTATMSDGTTRALVAADYTVTAPADMTTVGAKTVTVKLKTDETKTATYEITVSVTFMFEAEDADFMGYYMFETAATAGDGRVLSFSSSQSPNDGNTMTFSLYAETAADATLGIVVNRAAKFKFEDKFTLTVGGEAVTVGEVTASSVGAFSEPVNVPVRLGQGENNVALTLKGVGEKLDGIKITAPTAVRWLAGDETVFEAEDAVRTGGAIEEQTTAGRGGNTASGGKYVGSLAAGSKLTFNITSASAASAVLNIFVNRLDPFTFEDKLTLKVNGEDKVIGAIPSKFWDGGDNASALYYFYYAPVRVPIELVKDNNVIEFTFVGDNLNGSSNFDCISLRTLTDVAWTPTLSEIELNTADVKKDYWVGDTFSADGLVVTATMSDGTTATVAAADYEVSAPDMTAAGTQIVTVTYADKTATFEIIVSEVTTESIATNGGGGVVKTEFWTNEPFTYADLTVTATLSNGATRAVAAADYTVTAPDMTTAGTKTVTVAYDGKTATYEITVSDPVVTGITLNTESVKKSFYVDDTFTYAYLTVTATMSYGDPVTVAADAYTVTAPDMTTEGTKTVTVTYADKTQSYEITVTERPVDVPTPVSVTLNTESVKLTYWVGETFSAEGLVVTATMSDNSTQAVALVDCEIAAPDMTTAGTKTVTVKLAADKTKTATFDITVNDPVVTGITLDTTNAQKTFEAGETFNADGLVVTAAMSYGDPVTVAAGEYTVTAPDTTTAGEKTVTVAYAEKTATYTVTVNAPTVTAITLNTDNVKKEYWENEAFVSDGLVVTAAMSFGEPVSVSLNDCEISSPDMSTSGTKTVTVKYGGKENSFEITVKVTYIVTFNTMGGAEIEPVYTDGSSLTLPADPTRDKFTFDGWYIDKPLTTAFSVADLTAAPLTADLKLWAKWTQSGEVTYIFEAEDADFMGYYKFETSPTASGGKALSFWGGESKNNGKAMTFSLYADEATDATLGIRINRGRANNFEEKFTLTINGTQVPTIGDIAIVKDDGGDYHSYSQPYDVSIHLAQGKNDIVFIPKGNAENFDGIQIITASTIVRWFAGYETVFEAEQADGAADKAFEHTGKGAYGNTTSGGKYVGALKTGVKLTFNVTSESSASAVLNVFINRIDNFTFEDRLTLTVNGSSVPVGVLDVGFWNGDASGAALYYAYFAPVRVPINLIEGNNVIEFNFVADGNNGNNNFDCISISTLADVYWTPAA